MSSILTPFLMGTYGAIQFLNGLSLEKIEWKMSVRAAIAIGKIGVKGDQCASISALVVVGMIAATAGIKFDIYAISDRG